MAADPAAVVTGVTVAPVLDIRDLTVEIGRRRAAIRPVEQVSLRVEPGQTVGLVGESGSGKTMTAMAVMRLLPPGARIAAGTIAVRGRDVTTLRGRTLRAVRGREVGAVYQDPMSTLNPTMTVGAQIIEAVRAHREVGRRQARARALEVLELVRVPQPRERLGAFPFELSGGLRQRVVLAMALACEPHLLIADEPTTALDVTIQAQLLDLLDDLRGRLHMAVLLITHDLSVVAGRADRVAVMYAGRIVEEDDCVSIFRRPQHPYTEALLAAIPRPGQTKRDPLRTIPGLPPDLRALPPGCRFAPRCPHLQADCSLEEPCLRAAGAGASHVVACHHPSAARARGEGAAAARAAAEGAADTDRRPEQP